MKNPLLDPLLETFASEKQGEEADVSAANVVAWWMVHGPYLDDTYQTHQLRVSKNGQVRLWQDGADRGDRNPVKLLERDGYFDDERVDGEEFSLPSTYIEKMTPIGVDEVPKEILARAHTLLDRVRRAHPQAIARLLDPTDAQMSARQHITIREVDQDGLYGFLNEILGQLHDGSLRTYGVDYHTVPHYSHKARYLVAHNQDEVAGILKLGANRDWSYGLGYVAVAPGFRGRGLSKALFAAALGVCERDGKVLVRTDPGDFAEEHPETTARYDQMARDGGVLHVESGTYVEGAVERAVKQIGYRDACRAFKGLCDSVVPSREDRLAGISKWARRDALMKAASDIEAIREGLESSRREASSKVEPAFEAGAEDRQATAEKSRRTSRLR